MNKSVKIERVEFVQPVMLFDTGFHSEYVKNGQVTMGGDFTIKVAFDSDDRFMRLSVEARTEKAKKTDWVKKYQLISLNNCRAILVSPEESSVR